ncbi:MAG: acyl carrier protein [Maledivibacter sp.]|jgi:acyl carrier protein|nr:acyl carrier protein [Maledivibacter sp.]
MSEEIRKRVVNMLKEFIGEDEGLENLGPDDSLSAIGLNSVTFMRVVIAAEMEFEIEWDDRDLSYGKFSTINNITSYIESSINNKAEQAKA